MKLSFNRSFLSIITLLALTFGPIGSTPTHAMNMLQSTAATSPEGLLNPNGTLNMNKSFNGTLDIAGWNVQMDPLHGPVFTPAAALAIPDQWSSVGGGWSGAMTNGSVTTITVSGTDIYVGGYFTDINNNGTSLPAGDYIAKWDSQTGNWSALGSNGAGNGSLNNTVYEIAVSGTDVYVGGDFTNVMNNGTNLPAADYVAKWDSLTGNWSALGSNGAGNGSLNDYVHTVAVSGTDVYVGGRFTNVNNNGTILPAADKIAKWDSLTGNWSALGSNGANDGSLSYGTGHNYVETIAVSGTDVYVGGYFFDVHNNGASINTSYIAKWDGANWSALGSYPLNNTVEAIAISGTDVYVGGSFTNVRNFPVPSMPAADYVAKWNGSAWSALGSNGASGNGSLNHPVYAIVVSGTDLYVGGNFIDINNNGTIVPAADKIAKWDTQTGNWSALGSNGTGDGAIPAAIGEGDTDFSASVGAIAVSGTNIYAGGLFTGVKNNGYTLATGDHIIKWNQQTGDWAGLGASSSGGSLTNTVKAVAVSGTNVYVGGSFTNANNNGIILPAADYIAKWNGSAWSALGSNGAGNGSLSGNVTSLAVSGTDLYVGGNFINVNNNGTILHLADYVAKWNGSAWSALGSNGAGNGSLASGSSVLALAASGTDVYVGGHFTNVNNNGTIINAADYLAKWNGSAWSAPSSNGAGNGSLNGDVKTIAISGANVYVGGNFVNVNNNGTILNAADYVAEWNGRAWAALGSNGAGNGSLNSNVNTIAVNGTDVYVGGGFLNVNNNGTSLPAADYIAKWNGSAWAALGSNGAGNGSLNGNVNAIAVIGANLYVGGSFTNVNNNGASLPAADYIAKWNSGTWSALGSSYTANGSLDDSVYAIAADATDLFVGGNFVDVNNNSETSLLSADYIAAYGIMPRPSVTINQAAGQTDPTNTRLLSFTATFSETVSGFTNADVNVSLSGNCTPTVSVTGSGTTYNITLTNMLRECTATVSIPAGATQSISHPTASNMASTSTDNSQRFQYAVKAYTSIAANDGWILESAMGTNIGGSMNNAATILSVGDDATNREYRMITRFDTSTDPVPASAVIAGGNYRVTQANVTGTNPLNTHGSLRTFLKSPFFGSSANLETLDYQAGADTGICIFDITLFSDNGYRCIFYAAALSFIPKSGILDLRSQFDADNADGSADLLNIYSGNAASQRPKLYVTYYLLP